MRLAEMALGSKGGDSGAASADNEPSGDDLFAGAASEALEHWSNGRKDEAVQALSGAIDARIASYMAEDE